MLFILRDSSVELIAKSEDHAYSGIHPLRVWKAILNTQVLRGQIKWEKSTGDRVTTALLREYNTGWEKGNLANFKTPARTHIATPLRVAKRQNITTRTGIAFTPGG